LRNGAAGVDAIRRELAALPREGELAYQITSDDTLRLRRSVHLQAVALWLLAGLLGVVALVSVLAIVRQASSADEADALTLRALGTTQREFNAVAFGRGSLIGLAGGLVACAIAIVISAPLVFGLARVVEPDPGVTVDWLVLAVTFVVVAVIGVASSVVMAALARRTLAKSARARVRVLRGPAATNVPTGVGVRFACTGTSLLSRGIAGPAIGIAALAGALVFGASLANLRETPALYGWQWDFVGTNYGGVAGSIDPGSEEGMKALAATSEVDGVAVGSSLDVDVEGKHVLVATMDVVRGDPDTLLPPVVEGRRPNAGEIALARHTLDRLAVDIGDTVTMTTEAGKRTVTATVVGRVVIAPVFADAEPGEGALMPNRSTLDAFGIDTESDDAEIAGATTVYGILTNGATVDTALAAMNASLLESEQPALQPLYLSPQSQPSDLVDFGRVDQFPLVLGSVLGLLAAMTLTHVLVSSVLRRRQDLATLRALGLRGRQLGAVVGAQSGFLALLALVIGVPVGILVGRIAWSTYAERTGFISSIQVPALALAILVVGTLVVAELCAAIPARVASRTRAARLLRTE
jgi:predicted lysophospholipase L1 biosynthesis ABC-type transport system permease subunit